MSDLDLDTIEKLLPDLWGSPHYDAMKTLIEQVRKLTQENEQGDQCELCDNHAGDVPWMVCQPCFVARNEQAEQRVQELEQTLAQTKAHHNKYVEMSIEHQVQARTKDIIEKANRAERLENELRRIVAIYWLQHDCEATRIARDFFAKDSPHA